MFRRGMELVFCGSCLLNEESFCLDCCSSPAVFLYYLTFYSPFLQKGIIHLPMRCGEERLGFALKSEGLRCLALSLVRACMLPLEVSAWSMS